MKIKRNSHLFAKKLLFGIIGLVVLLCLLSVINRGEGESNFLKNKLEDASMFDAEDTKAIDFSDFLDLYAKKNYTILLASYDDFSAKLGKAKVKLKNLGSNKIETVKYRDSYAAIIENGIFVKEDLSSDSLASVDYDNFIVSGLGFGKKSEKGTSAGMIYVEDISKNEVILTKNLKRGLNALVYKNNGDIIKEVTSYHFDFFEDENSVSKGLRKIFIPHQDKLTIEIEEKDFDKIKKKREEALDLGLLLAYDDDWVPAKINYKEKTYKAEIRLKGDWTDHLVHKNKWSYKVKLEDGTIFGTNKFSIQTAAARNYMGEWMFHYLLKKGDVIALRYNFLKVAVNINGKGDSPSLYSHVGVMAFEEGFTKYLLENNGRKEGVILKIDESLGWEDFKKGGRNFSNPTLPISAFEMSKILKDSSKYNQFTQAKDMLHSYYLSKEVKPSTVFDLNKYAYWDALGTYTAGTHGHRLHNQRFYYNATTSLLEPVGFDALGYYFSEEPFKVYYSFPEDSQYRKLVLTKLNKLMQMSYTDIESLFLQENLVEASNILTSEYPKKTDELNDAMHKRIDKINAFYDLSHPLDIYLEEMNRDKIILNFRNVSKLDIEVLGIKYRKKNLAIVSEPIYVIDNSFKKDTLKLLEGSYNIFFGKATKTTDKSKFQEITIFYRVAGTSKIKTEKVIPYPYYDKEYTDKDVMRKKMTLSHFPFLELDETKKTIQFSKGNEAWELNEPLRIDEGYTVNVQAGFELDIEKGGLIISKSPVFFKGEKESPIKIFSSSKLGGGLVVLQNEIESIVSYTVFDGLKNPSYNKWSVTGAVTFYEAPVTLSNVWFQNNGCEDALNIVRTEFNMDNIHFYNTQSDAFDGDFVTGKMTNSFFDKLGNDGVDVSGSNITLEGIEVNDAGDKAISIGENSKATIKQTTINNSAIGVNTKDLSTTTIENMNINNTRLAFTAFQKKDEYGAGHIVANNVVTHGVELMYLIEVNSSMIFNGSEIDAKVSGVKDKMYGNDYGRKSVR